MSQRLHHLIVTAAAISAFALGASAQQTWDNGSSDGLWNTTSLNFDGGSAYTEGNDVIFGDTGAGTVTYDPLNVGTILLGNTAGNAFTFSPASGGLNTGVITKNADGDVLFTNGGNTFAGIDLSAGNLTLATTGVSDNNTVGTISISGGTLQGTAIATKTPTENAQPFDGATVTLTGGTFHMRTEGTNNRTHDLNTAIVVNAPATIQASNDQNTTVHRFTSLALNADVNFLNGGNNATSTFSSMTLGASVTIDVNTKTTQLPGFDGTGFTITKTGDGELLPGGGTVIDGLIVDGGSLVSRRDVTYNSAIMLRGGVAGDGDATLRLSNTAVNAGGYTTLTANVDVAAGTGGRTINNQGSNNSDDLSGTVTLSNDLTVDSRSNGGTRYLGLSGQVTGTGDLNFVSAQSTGRPAQITGLTSNDFDGDVNMNIAGTDPTRTILRLGKAEGEIAVPGNLNITAGTVILGEYLDPSQATSSFGTGGEQIADTATVSMSDVAIFDLNGFSETIASLVMLTGAGNSMVDTDNFDSTLSGTLTTDAWTIDGTPFSPGTYTAASGVVNGFDLSQFIVGAGSIVIPSALIPGDADGDGDVDGDDFNAWGGNFPTASGATLAQGDFDGDGDVDGDDFNVWGGNFPYPGPGAASAVSEVPEPASLALIGLGAIALLRRRS